MTARLDREGLRLADVSGKAYDGQVNGLFELKNTDGTGLFSAQLKLTGADLGTDAADTGLAAGAMSRRPYRQPANRSTRWWRHFPVPARRRCKG